MEAVLEVEEVLEAEEEVVEVVEVQPEVQEEEASTRSWGLCCGTAACQLTGVFSSCSTWT